MFKKLFFLTFFVFVLSIFCSVQASPVSVDPSVELIVGTDGIVPPEQSNYKTYNMQVRNFTNERRVTLVSFDISGLRDLDQAFSNMSLSNLGGPASGTVDVYGVVESEDNISSNLSWTNTPGVENLQPIQHSVRLDMDDLTDKLLSFKAPALDVRESTGTSQALDDFLNSDLDGIVTLLLAPAKDGTDVLMRTTRYPGGGMTLSGEVDTYLWITAFEDDFEAAHDYLNDGLGAYDGMLNGTISALDASTNREGELYLESSNASWDPGPAPLLYVNVTGDFIVTVKVTDFAGTADEPLFHNSAGITARDPASDGGLENWVSMDYFPTWTAFVARSTTDGSRRELGQTAGRWTGADTYGIAAQYPYIQLERDGDNFYPRISADGVSFIPLTDPAYQGIYDGTQAPLVINRPDLPDTLQIGLNNATFSGDVGYVAFDDLCIQTQILPTDPGTDNLTHSYTFEDGTANDSVGEAHGTLVGGAEVVDGAMVTTEQDQWMSMPGDVIAMNTYDEVTIAAWYTPTEGANTSWSMLAYFGGNANGLGSDGFFITSARGDDKSRAAISIGDESSPWASESGADGPELDDGLLHHMVSTINATDITLYIDGVLMESTPLSETNNIAGISQELALLAKGGYDGDPEWIGSIDEFNIYNKALSLAEIMYLAGRVVYTYDGDAAEYGTGDFDSLDGTWDRQNSSDSWDGSAPGDPDPNNAPGGAGVFTEDSVTFLRIQDTGNPRDLGYSDPSNRKLHFGHSIGFAEMNGANLEFRIRIATTPPLDGLNPDTPWPEGGKGSMIADRGKGMVGIGDAEQGGMISFSLTKADEIAAVAGFEEVTTDVLVMNNLVGTESSGDVDTGDGGITAVNYLPLDDATAWNTFAVKIVAGGAGTHIVSISANDGPAQSFEVTVGSDNDIGPGNYIAMGNSSTGSYAAFDVDYITFK